MMPEEKTLAVDFTKENALSQILSRAPLVSYEAEWTLANDYGSDDSNFATPILKL